MFAYFVSTEEKNTGVHNYIFVRSSCINIHDLYHKKCTILFFFPYFFALHMRTFCIDMS